MDKNRDIIWPFWSNKDSYQLASALKFDILQRTIGWHSLTLTLSYGSFISQSYHSMSDGNQNALQNPSRIRTSSETLALSWQCLEAISRCVQFSRIQSWNAMGIRLHILKPYTLLSLQLNGYLCSRGLHHVGGKRLDICQEWLQRGSKSLGSIWSSCRLQSSNLPFWYGIL